MTSHPRRNERLLKIIDAHYRQAIAEPEEYLKFGRDIDRRDIIYVLVHNISGPDDEYKFGEFMFRMEFPDNYPYDPPYFFAMNENGLYKPESRVCISIGEYHKDQFRASLKLSGFARELANGLMCWRDMGHGINIVSTTREEKVKIASASRGVLQSRFPEILVNVEEQFAEYSKEFGKRKPAAKPGAKNTAPPTAPKLLPTPPAQNAVEPGAQ